MCLLALPAVLGNEMVQSNADTQTHLIVDDTFNNSKYTGKVDGSKWVDYSESSIGQSLQGETYMYNNHQYSGVEHVDFSTKFELTGLKYFQFDYRYDQDSLDASRWFSLYFVDDPEILVAKIGTPQYLPYLGAGSINAKSINPLGLTGGDGVNLVDQLGTNAVDNWISIRYTPTSATTVKIAYAIAGDDFTAAHEKTYTYNQEYCDLQNAFVMFGFSHDAGGVMIDNIYAEYSTSSVLDVNFDDFDIDANPYFELVYFNKADPDACNVQFICDSKLEIGSGDVNSYIQTKQEAKNDNAGIQDVTLLETTFDLFMADGDKIALVFGLQEGQTDLRKNCVVYEISSSKAILREYDEKGEQTTTDKNNTNTFSKVKTLGSTIKITYTLEDGITIYENDVKVKNSGAKVAFEMVENVFGFIALQTIENTAKKSYIDNIRIYNSYYYIPVTKSVTHNFSNDFFGNEGYKDFYVNDPSGAGKTTVKDGKLVWAMASDNTFFGSAHQYDNFILDFKLCSIKADVSQTDTKEYTAVYKWLGLDLSRSKVDYFEYGSYLTLMTMITQPADAKSGIVSMWNQPTSTTDRNAIKMKNFETVDPDLFRAIQYRDDSAKASVKAEDAVCFRYVSNNGTLSFYLKKACEKEFTKYWEYYDLELNGYFALCCTGWTYLELDDFSMANTSQVYECADNEAPETITEVVTKTVYDNQNGKVDFDEEIKINTKSGCGSSIIASSVAATVIGLVGVAGLFIKRKK